MSEGRRVAGVGSRQTAFVGLPSGPARPAQRLASRFDHVRITHDVLARALRRRRVRRPHPRCSRPALAAGRDDLGQAAPARRRALHRGLDDLRHRALTVDIATHFSPLGKVDHLHRRQHRRHGRADARLDPRPGDLQAPRPAREAHRGERHQSAARARRPGQRGPDRAPRRGRPAAAHGRPVDARDRGACIAVAAVPRRSILAGIDPLDALWEAPFYAAMAFTNTGFTPEPRRPRAVRRRLLPAHGPDGRRVPRLASASR